MDDETRAWVSLDQCFEASRTENFSSAQMIRFTPHILIDIETCMSARWRRDRQ